jgi:NCS2 family nucleobase:cation symporter-2
MGIALAVLVAILLIAKFAKGFFANIAVLLGIIFGGIIAVAVGKMSFTSVGNAPWFDLVYPLQFGMPTFDFWSIVTMSIVMIVVMVESTGMFLALGEMTGKKVSQDDLTRGLRADGVGTILGGIFNTFPYTSFSQNVGLVGVTGVRSRWVAIAGGVILLVLGLIPKLAAVFASIPVFVLGGAGIVMFGMVAATGIRILSNVDYNGNRNNLMIVAVGIGVGMLTLIAPNIFDKLPKELKPILDSGILLTTIVAVILNAFFNGSGSDASGQKDASEAAMKTGLH